MPVRSVTRGKTHREPGRVKRRQHPRSGCVCQRWQWTMAVPQWCQRPLGTHRYVGGFSSQMRAICPDTGAVVSQVQLESEMKACGFMDDANKMYTRCLQVNHPVHHGWNHARWTARGSLCTTLVNSHDAPVSYGQSVANETDAALKNNDCIDRGADAAFLQECDDAYPHRFMVIMVIRCISPIPV